MTVFKDKVHHVKYSFDLFYYNNKWKIKIGKILIFKTRSSTLICQYLVALLGINFVVPNYFTSYVKKIKFV